MPITKDFDNAQWFETKDGSGFVGTSDSGGTLTCRATGIDRAYKKYYIIAMPGEVLTFSCYAKNRVQDGIAGFARMWIDNRDGTEEDFATIESSELGFYQVAMTVDSTATGPQRVFFGLGVFGSIEGSADYLEPTMHRSGSNIVMQGQLELPNGGGFILRSDSTNYNVGDIEWRASTQTYRIKPKLPFNFSDQEIVPFDIQFRPLTQVTASYDGNLTEPYVWYGLASNNVAWLELQAVSLATGLPVNLSASTNLTRFVNFIVTMEDGG